MAGKYILSDIYEKTNNQKILKNSNKSTRKKYDPSGFKKNKIFENVTK